MLFRLLGALTNFFLDRRSEMWQHRLFEAERTRDIGKNSLGRGYMHVAQLRKLWKQKESRKLSIRIGRKKKRGI